MAMRAQFLQYETTTATNGRILIFNTMFGRIMHTQATEFIVIEDIGCSPYAEYTSGYTDIIVDDVDVSIQIKINTTEYFMAADGSSTNGPAGTPAGVPGRASPYPRSNNVYPSFKLEPDVYVLPGQNWELILYKDTTNVSALVPVPSPFPTIRCFVKYTLYDGTDAVLANQLLELGITVKPKNIDWLKRKLIEESKPTGGAF